MEPLKSVWPELREPSSSLGLSQSAGEIALQFLRGFGDGERVPRHDLAHCFAAVSGPHLLPLVPASNAHLDSTVRTLLNIDLDSAREIPGSTQRVCSSTVAACDR